MRYWTIPVLLLSAASAAYSNDELTEHEQVYSALSPEMRAVINKMQEEQVNTPEDQGRSDSGNSSEMQVLVIKDHPVAVAAVNEDGELIITEF